MSYVNLPPEPTFAKLERVLVRQKRLMLMDVAATAVFAGSLVASLASLL